jgi:penicillin-insensitive murein DD-endopeptidase
MRSRFCWLILLLFCGTAAAEDISRPQNKLGTKSLPERISNKTAAKQPTAKELFGAVSLPAPLPSRAHWHLCKRLSCGRHCASHQRSRLAGHALVAQSQLGAPSPAYLEQLASDARTFDGWPGLLIGDMAQPRGAPMITGHESHQIGLDADRNTRSPLGC